MNKSTGKEWTSEELDLLCKKYSYMKAGSLQLLLPRHTVKAIYNKARALCLSAWTGPKTETSIIMHQVGKEPVESIADRMGYSSRTIYRRIRAARLDNNSAAL